MSLRVYSGVLLLLAAAAVLRGQQQNEPHAGYAYPAGGQRGTTVRVIVGGQFLDGVDGLIVSGTGVTAHVIELDKPMTPAQLTELREKLRGLQQRRTESEVRQEIESIRTAMAENQRRIANRAIAERVTVELTISPNAAPGDRSLRLATPRGLTNPVVFEVGEVPEFAEETAVAAIPATMNGWIRPGEPDRHRFSARKGQEIAIAARARALVPYLADAVPGWFQAALTLYDSAGRELAYADDDQFDPDPRLRHRIPADGEYAVEIKDALYRGREDFVYRLTIADTPVAGDLGSPCAEDPKTARRSLPIAVTACIARPGEWDVFTFPGRAGEPIVADVTARRTRSPLDSAMELLDPGGRRIAFNDDADDPLEGRLTHDADSRIQATLPVTGTYTVRVTDAQRRGGPDYAYQLRISAPEPDFALRAIPSTINVAPGTSATITVVARRIDGFPGAIALTLGGAPRGFTLGDGVVSAEQTSARLTLSVPPGVRRGVFTVRLEGRATIDGKVVEHVAVAADDMMQAFAYHHLVPADALRIAVSPRRARRAGL